MTIAAVTSNTTALASAINAYRNHLQGEASSTEAWLLRSSTGNDFIIVLSDNAAARKFSVRDSDNVEVAFINSDGAMTINGTLTAAGVVFTNFDFPSSATPTPTAEARAAWDTDDNLLAVGDGAATKIIIPTPTTTAGDLEYASGARAHSRLAIGTAGQTLRVNSGATAPAWETAVVFNYKSSTQVFTTTTTYADVDGAIASTFVFTAAANEEWRADYWIPLAFGGTGGVKFLLTTTIVAPTNVDITGERTVMATIVATDIVPAAQAFTVGTAFETDIAAANSAASYVAANYYSGSPAFVHIHLRLRNGANAGTVTLQAAQNSANSTTTLGLGSFMRAERMSY